MQNCYFYLLGGNNMLHLFFFFVFFQTQPLPVKKARSQNKSKDATHLSLHDWHDMGELGEGALCTEKIWRCFRGGTKLGKNVNLLNLTWNSRLCSRHLEKDKISTDGYSSGDPVYFAWNNWKKPLAQGRLERQRSEKSQTRVSPAMSTGGSKHRCAKYTKNT